MVKLTVYATANDFDLLRYLSVTDVIESPTAGGSNVFYTNTDVYGATLFAQRDGGGVWRGSLYAGAAIIDGNGDPGFAPQALVTGEVRGLSIDAYVATLAALDLSADAIEAKILSGADQLTGNVLSDTLEGFAEDDHLYGGGGGDFLDGGGGNDVLYGNAGSNVIAGGRGDDLIFSGTIQVESGSDRISGGSGDDVIVVGSFADDDVSGDRGDDLIIVQPGSAAVSQVYGGRGADTIYLSGPTSDYLTLDPKDHVKLDPEYFSSLQSGVQPGNIVIGNDATPKDADDCLLFDTNGFVLYYDPDGSGPTVKVKLLNYLTGRFAVTAGLFDMGHVDMPTDAASPDAAHFAAQHHAVVPIELLAHLA